MTADDIYRILAPSEYKALLAAIQKINKRILVETMLNTGMRYEELRAFGENPRWFSAKDKVIRLPGSSTKTGKTRNVYLVPAFSEKLELYLASNELKFPLRQAMAKDLHRWWYNNQSVLLQDRQIRYIAEDDTKRETRWYPLPKTFRKTWVSYLLAMEYPLMKVSQSMGHTVAVCEHHYANMDPCLITEKEAVKELTRGWMT